MSSPRTSSSAASASTSVRRPCRGQGEQARATAPPPRSPAGSALRRDEPLPRRLVGALGVADEPREEHVVPVPEPAVARRGVVPDGGDHRVVQVAPAVELRQRARAGRRTPDALAARRTGRPDGPRRRGSAPGAARPAPASRASRRRAGQPQAGARQVTGERLVGERQVAGQRGRWRACPEPGSAWVTAWARASHGSGSPACSRTPVARLEPLAASDPARAVDGVRQRAGRTRAPARRTGRWRPRSPLAPRRTPSPRRRWSGTAGRRAARHPAPPTGLTTTSSSAWVCPRTEARHSSTRSPSSGTTTTDTRPISEPSSPTRPPTTPEHARAHRPRHPPERRAPELAQAGPWRHAGHRNDVSAAVGAGQSRASSRSRSSPSPATSNSQLARRASVDSGSSGRCVRRRPEVVGLAALDRGEQVLVAGEVAAVVEHHQRLETTRVHDVEQRRPAEPGDDPRLPEQPRLVGQRVLLGVEDREPPGGEPAFDVLQVATDPGVVRRRVGARDEDPGRGLRRPTRACSGPRRCAPTRRPDPGARSGARRCATSASPTPPDPTSTGPFTRTTSSSAIPNAEKTARSTFGSKSGRGWKSTLSPGSAASPRPSPTSARRPR